MKYMVIYEELDGTDNPDVNTSNGYDTIGDAIHWANHVMAFPTYTICIDDVEEENKGESL